MYSRNSTDLNLKTPYYILNICVPGFVVFIGQFINLLSSTCTLLLFKSTDCVVLLSLDTDEDSLEYESFIHFTVRPFVLFVLKKLIKKLHLRDMDEPRAETRSREYNPSSGRRIQ